MKMHMNLHIVIKIYLKFKVLKIDQTVASETILSFAVPTNTLYDLLR